MPQAKSEIMVDDMRVIATKWTLPPGGETGQHTHALDYVVVYLTEGVLTVLADGEEIEAPVSKEMTTSRPAGISHNVLNRSTASIVFIEIELKKP